MNNSTENISEKTKFILEKVLAPIITAIIVGAIGVVVARVNNETINELKSEIVSLKTELEDAHTKINSQPDYELLYNKERAENCSIEGKALYDEKQYSRAIDKYLQAINFDDSNVHYYLICARAYYYLNNYEKSIEYFTKVIELDSNYDRDTYYLRAISYRDIQEYNNAINDLLCIINNDPIDYIANFQIALTYQWKSNYESAILYYNRCVDIDPTDSSTYHNLANIYQYLNEFEKALSYRKLAMENTPEDEYYKEVYEELFNELYGEF